MIYMHGITQIYHLESDMNDCTYIFSQYIKILPFWGCIFRAMPPIAAVDNLSESNS